METDRERDRRKKRTSTNQYKMYIEMMERDPIFASGRVTRDMDSMYMTKRWKELSDRLNTCNSGPKLSCDEWRKRLNDWKNTTRCKYRRSFSGEKDISMTALEMKALNLFGKAHNPSVDLKGELSVHLKSEQEDEDEEIEQRTSEAFQKELQAAVEEAIGGDEDEEELIDEQEHDQLHAGSLSLSGNSALATSSNNAPVTTKTYRTIVVENSHFADEDNNDDNMEFISHRRNAANNTTTAISTGVQTLNPTTTTTTVTKLINGEIPLKRMRTQPTEQVIYEVKKAPVTQRITLHNSNASSTPQIHHAAEVSSPTTSSAIAITSADARELARQLKRMADIKAEKLKFEVARFKFNNPGFNYNCNF